MAIFKALTFDEVNSLDYGIYITGEAAYNAPERAVEMINIPGKNGALALDQGRFENIEVTYHAGCFADSQADFADKVMRFRNALASRYTYKRLTDEYHSDEYRLGLYKSGLDVDAVRYGTAGQFDITFDCKPQRWLAVGETEQTFTSSGSITNPTPFESKPLIKVTGTGTLGIGEYILTITGTASQTLYIDCETMEIYTLEGTVPTGASSLVSINKNDFPVLEPGTNYISVGSGITAVTITPRWWRI